MERRIGSLVALCLATGMLAAGCGGDDEEEGSDGEALSTTEFIEQGDAICAEGDAEIDQAAAEAFGDVPPGERPPPEELARFGEETVAPNIQDQIDQLRELPAPEGDEETLSAIFDAADEGIAEIEENPDVLATQEGPPSLAEASELAAEYGFQDCGG